MICTALLLAAALQQAVKPRFERYAVDPQRSEVGFDATTKLHDFTGRSRLVTGTLRVDMESPAFLAAGYVSISARSLDTDNGSRDKEMVQRLDASRNPTISFAIDRVQGELLDRKGRLFADGTFTIHGVRRKRRVAVDVTPLEDAAIRVRGRVKFDMSDHDIDPPGMLVFKVADEVEVFLDLVLVPVRSDPLPAQAYSLEVVDRLAADGGEVREERRSEWLWVTAGGLLWERRDGPYWVVSRDGRATSVDLSRPPATDLAAEGAPPAEARAQVVTGKGRTEVRADGTAWAVFEGERAPESVGPMLATIDGVPQAVRAALNEVPGLPEHILLRARTPDGVRTLEVRVAEAVPGTVPNWFEQPSSWMGETERTVRHVE